MQYVTTTIDDVDVELRSKEQILPVLKHNLLKVQSCMKKQYDKHYKDINFDLGDCVLEIRAIRCMP